MHNAVEAEKMQELPFFSGKCHRGVISDPFLVP